MAEYLLVKTPPRTVLRLVQDGGKATKILGSAFISSARAKHALVTRYVVVGYVDY